MSNNQNTPLVHTTRQIMSSLFAMNFLRLVLIVACLSSAAVAANQSPIISILLPPELEKDAGYQLALRELNKVLEKKGYEPTTRHLKSGDQFPTGNKIVVGDLGLKPNQNGLAMS
jgi:hypothetical protein